MSIKYFDMFAGIGGFRSGLEKIGGFKCIGYCEIDKYAKKAYEIMYDTKGELYYENARTINPETLPDIDLIVAGFPCQSFSISGARRGFEDTRGTLFFEIARIAKYKRPKYLLLENVPGLLSNNQGRTFKTIISTLDELGYDVTWQVLNSKDFGVAQSRKRVYIIGFLRGKCDGEILSFTKTNAKTLIQRKGGRQGDRIYSENGLSCTLTSGTGGVGGKTGLYSLEEFSIPIKSKTKTGYKLAYNGDSIDTSFANTNTRRGRVGEQIAHTLTTSSTQAYYFIDLNINPKITEIARCIQARYDAGIGKRKGERSGLIIENDASINLENRKFAIAFVDKDNNVHIGRVRKLTPLECFRLQGFTDEQFNKLKEINMSDCRLYKLAGNAVTVPVISEIAQKIKEIDERTR